MLCILLPASLPIEARDRLTDVFPGTGLGMPMGPAGFGSLPFPDDDSLSPFTDFMEPYREHPYPWPAPHTSERSGMSPPNTSYESRQPDLTGIWRGSGGETVDIRRNRARIWNQNRQSCDCVFKLLDEDGNLMTFQRAR
jgi:hypothetical protein